MGKLGHRIGIGIPTTSQARRSMAWIMSLNQHMPLGSAAVHYPLEDMPIAAARNAICQQAINDGCEYLFFVSDDVLAPLNAVISMLDKIGRKYPDENGRMVTADFISGVYWTKTYPSDPYLWNGMLKGPYKDWTAGEFFPVDLAGCDCLLIDLKRLQEVPYPWFSTDWVWEPGQKPSPIATEDFYFFLKARKHGLRLFADTSIQCLHEDRGTGTMFGLTADMPQAGGMPEFADDAVVVADLGAGQDSPYFGINATVVRFDGRPEVRPDVRCDLAHIDERYFGQFDVVHTRHVLEHFPRNMTLDLVGHWCKLAKDGGKLIVRVPNIEHALKTIATAPDGHPDKKYAWDQIYGGQQYDGDFHFQGFTPKKLLALLQNIPALTDAEVTLENDELNLKGTATVRHKPPEALTDMLDEIAKREGTTPPVSDSKAAA